MNTYWKRAHWIQLYRVIFSKVFLVYGIILFYFLFYSFWFEPRST